MTGVDTVGPPDSCPCRPRSRARRCRGATRDRWAGGLADGGSRRSACRPPTPHRCPRTRPTGRRVPRSRTGGGRSRRGTSKPSSAITVGAPAAPFWPTGTITSSASLDVAVRRTGHAGRTAAAFHPATTPDTPRWPHPIRRPRAGGRPRQAGRDRCRHRLDRRRPPPTRSWPARASGCRGRPDRRVWRPASCAVRGHRGHRRQPPRRPPPPRPGGRAVAACSLAAGGQVRRHVERQRGRVVVDGGVQPSGPDLVGGAHARSSLR